MADRVSVSPATPRSYSTTSGPKQAEQTYDAPSGSGRPQLRQARPVIRGGAALGAGEGLVSISVVIGGSRGTGDRKTGGDEKTLPATGRVSNRELPYRAGGPARTWHLAGSSPVGCRGITGPVPPPTLDKGSSVVRGAYRRRGPGSTPGTA